MKKEKSISLDLFLTFMKIGAFSFGGGYAMIPMIRKEAVDKRQWITDQDILDITALAESTPGPVAINSATFIGSRLAGFRGAFASTFGVVLPSFVIIFAISFILKRFESFMPVQWAFAGIRAAVLALMVQALIGMYRACHKGIFEYILMGAAFAAVVFFDVNVLIIIAFCAGFGLLRAAAIRRRSRDAD